MDENVTQLPMADMPESDYDKSVGLSRKELLGLWGKGVMPPLPYVYAALKLDGYFLVDNGDSRSFDIGAFCLRWSADESFTLSGKKPKPLSHRQVVNALAMLDEKKIAVMPDLGSKLKMQGV